MLSSGLGAARIAESMEVAQHVLRGCESRDIVMWMPFCHFHQAVAHEWSGNWPSAARSMQRMADCIDPGGAWALVDAKIAQVNAHLGRPEAAREHAGRALDNLSEVVFGIQRSGVILLSIEGLLWSSGNEARDEIEELIDKLEREMAEPLYRPLLHKQRAHLALVCDDQQTCDRERAEAQRLWREMGAQGWIARMDRELAEVRASHELS